MNSFKSDLSMKITRINDDIYSYLPPKGTMADKVIDAMHYSVKAGGKRIRPLIMSETFIMCGGSGNIIRPFMAALEFIHTYSLVHDDLPAMDNDMYRRGNLTTHAKYGEDMGILTGDALLNYAFETVLNSIVDADPQLYSRCIKALSVLASKSGISGMVGGQVLDVELTGRSMDKDQMDFIFRLKTGALIEAAFMIGAILAGASDSDIAKLEMAGRSVGIAFQIQDDILDLTSTTEELGKPVLSDEKNQKTTYVTLYGMNKAKEDVVRYSEDALRLIKEVGTNDFLCALVEELINRTK